MQNKVLYERNCQFLSRGKYFSVNAQYSTVTVTVTTPFPLLKTTAFCFLLNNQGRAMQNKSPTRHLQASPRASACVVVITAQTKALRVLRGDTHEYRKQSGGHDGDA